MYAERADGVHNLSSPLVQSRHPSFDVACVVMDDLPDSFDDLQLGPPQTFSSGSPIVDKDKYVNTVDMAHLMWDDHDSEEEGDYFAPDDRNNALVVTDSNQCTEAKSSNTPAPSEKWLLDTASYRHYSKSKQGGTFQPVKDFTLKLQTIKGEAEINDV